MQKNNCILKSITNVRIFHPAFGKLELKLSNVLELVHSFLQIHGEGKDGEGCRITIPVLYLYRSYRISLYFAILNWYTEV